MSKHTYAPACTRVSVPQCQKTKMARNTDVQEDYTHRQGFPSRQDQRDRRWHNNSFKVYLTAPVQCHLQHRIMEHDHKQIVTIFPGPAEASLESKETFTCAHELKEWKKGTAKPQNSWATTITFLCPSSALHRPTTPSASSQIGTHLSMSSGQILVSGSLRICQQFLS